MDNKTIPPLGRFALISVALSLSLWGQRGGTRPVDPHPLILANDKLEFTMSATGGRFNKLVLKEGEPISPIAALGHFIALDGFGAPSDEEKALGWPGHGEASRVPMEIVGISPATPARSVTLRGTLPLAQETVTRSVEMVNGENIIYVTTQLESNLTVDRPFSYAEHATLGPPFLEKGKVVVDMPATNCRVRPYKPGPIPGHLVYDKDFKWPMAPTVDGGQADIRVYPTDHAWLDLASCQLDVSRRLAYVTALHLEKHLVYGYVFRRADYPWLMSWMNFTGDDRAARGMEFSTQPFDISHKDTVAMSPLFGQPTYRWLPAKSTIENKFLIFYTKVPDDFTKIDDVTFADGKVTIIDHSGKRVVLPASKEF